MRCAPKWLYFMFCVGLLSGAANAADNSTALQWQALTRIDIAAAYDLLQENHPGTLPEVGDKLFTDTLAAAHAKALDRAAKVRDIEGHNATLAAFANSMGDGHIWSHDVFERREFAWAGIIAAKRGPDWVVSVDDPQITGTELSGARIVRCDAVLRPRWRARSCRFTHQRPTKPSRCSGRAGSWSTTATRLCTVPPTASSMRQASGWT